MPDDRTTAFEWSRYADATLAGLSVLIPVPFADDAFEAFFRRRISGAVARARGRELPAEVRAVLDERESAGGGWASIPVRLTVGGLKRLSRKLLYFLTVKTATDRLAYYWYRAFLMDHMLEAGHLDDAATARVASRAMEEVLATTRGPLPHLARQLVASSRGVWPALRQVRQGREAPEVQRLRAQLQGGWGEIAGQLGSVATRYDEAYARLSRAS
jgi:hypothetical protein